MEQSLRVSQLPVSPKSSSDLWCLHEAQAGQGWVVREGQPGSGEGASRLQRPHSPACPHTGNSLIRLSPAWVPWRWQTQRLRVLTHTLWEPDFSPFSMCVCVRERETSPIGIQKNSRIEIELV